MMMKLDLNMPITDVMTAGNLWCVYEHISPANGEIVYVSTCKLTDVFHMHQGHNNSEWRNLIETDPRMIIRIVAVTDDNVAAFNEARRIINAKQPQPRCNLYGYNLTGSQGVIVCNDGRIFMTQGEAARALGCSQSSVSQHLSGKLDSVKGFKLARQKR